MKSNIDIHIADFRILGFALAFLLVLPTSAQDKKERLRIGAVYTKIMDGPVYLDLSTSARIDRSNVKVPDIGLDVFYEVDGEEYPLGEVRTGANGDVRFTMDNPGQIQPDSTGLYILSATFEGDDTFRRASRSIEFRDAAIRASLKTQDSINYIEASLSDTVLDSLVEGALIKVQVKRMFKPLQISEEFLMTDTNGSILVPVPGDIPGKDGILDIEVVIEENDTFATVKTSLEAKVGTPIAHISTYDQRALWARSSKSPIFILIFTGVLIFGAWGLVIYLIINMYRIAKN
ncbi:MAG: hypothetical protein WBM43_11695 [Flavobacteriaceae bacterium]